jgi:hypothetical protein
MVQSQSALRRKSKARELLDWARDKEQDDGLRALVNSSIEREHGQDISTDTDLDNVASSKTGMRQVKRSRMQKEMDELERWLEDEDSEMLRALEDPWVIVPPLASADLDVMGTLSSLGGGARTHQGFDDDFTVFVSAPAAPSSSPSPSGVSTPIQNQSQNVSFSFDSDRLEPSAHLDTSASYRSLGSVSDFGDEGSAGGADRAHHNVSDDDDVNSEGEDGDLPSKAEIQAASMRIFGPPPVLRATAPSPAKPQNVSQTARSVPPASETVLGTMTPLSTSPASNVPTDFEDEEEDSARNFDLSRVLSALQTMKAEIAEMGTEEEKRRAAARAALGLVYGLGIHRDEGEEMEVEKGGVI